MKNIKCNNRLRHFRLWWSMGLGLSLAAVSILSASAQAQQESGLAAMQRLFQNPPDDARPMVRWWWFGPAVTKAEITRELRAMKDGGLGGVEIQPVYPVALDGEAGGVKNLSYLSDEHIEALRHANAEARALGLRVDLTLGSGWPFGGPSTPITQAAGRLRVERVKPQEAQQRVPMPQMAEGEALLAAFLVRAKNSGFDPGRTREITGMSTSEADLPDGWAVGDEVLFFISSRTKQQVKRASAGAEGFVLDHYSRTATEEYLKRVGDRLMQAFGDQPPYAVFCDSLEVYLSDWTPDLLAEFQKRRGYDLKPYLPALVADYGPRTASIRHDWGQTLTELLNERFVQPMREWAARHHTRFRMQAYGTPPATLSTNRFVDLPEGEGFQWKVLRASRWASSASHLYGRPVTSSETWTWLHSPAFRATPLDMKAEADLHFLQGINQLIGHGWPYSAPGAEYPGWRFYAAGALSDKNPWWIVMPELAKYLQRTSYLLRQGQPASDVAIYLPNSDAWAQFQNRRAEMINALRERIGDDVVASTLEAGYNFDFFDDEALREVGKAEPGGALALGANRYKAVILPNVERIPPESLRKLADFAQGGGALIATRRLPERAPGFQAAETQHQEVRETARRLFEGPGAPGHFVADAKKDLAETLNGLLRPDADFAGNKADIGYVHRRTREAEIYFLANTSPKRVEMKAAFRVSGATRAEWWNPFDGTAAPALVTPIEDGGGVALPLALEPYESRVLVFTPREIARPVADAPAAGVVATDAATADGGATLLDLSGGWRVSFADGPAVPMDKLRSWSEDEATRHYSGAATYEKTFDAPPAALSAGAPVLLDFGPTKALPAQRTAHGFTAWVDAPVREAALVYVNGERAGAVWHPPYRVDVTRLLRPGENRLKIVVGNTAINAMAGHPQPDDARLNGRYGERFKAQDMENLQPLPSGLLGPIRLLR